MIASFSWDTLCEMNQCIKTDIGYIRPYKNAMMLEIITSIHNEYIVKIAPVDVTNAELTGTGWIFSDVNYFTKFLYHFFKAMAVLEE